jgi:hypothetical protein
MPAAQGTPSATTIATRSPGTVAANNGGKLRGAASAWAVANVGSTVAWSPSAAESSTPRSKGTRQSPHRETRLAIVSMGCSVLTNYASAPMMRWANGIPARYNPAPELLQQNRRRRTTRWLSPNTKL